MFEKEAEEYIKEHSFFDEEGGVLSLDVGSKTIFEDGAEFGYNKANEWHKVLDGDFPKHNNEVLCLFWGGIKEVGYYKNELWYFEDFTADKDDVDYWQEIVLPEVKENGKMEPVNNVVGFMTVCLKQRRNNNE